MLHAQHVRVWPHDALPGDARLSLSLQVELLGCAPGTGWKRSRRAGSGEGGQAGTLSHPPSVSPLVAPPGPGAEHCCASGPRALSGAPCGRVQDCELGSDEEGCVPPPTGMWCPTSLLALGGSAMQEAPCTPFTPGCLGPHGLSSCSLAPAESPSCHGILGFYAIFLESGV